MPNGRLTWKPRSRRGRSGIPGASQVPKPSYVYAFSLALLVVGVGAGYILREAGTAGRTAAVHRELQDMRRTIALSMLDRPLASDRIEGVGWSTRLESPDRKTLQALVDTLDSDSNINVRLAAVDALYLFRNDPGVKDSMIRSLGKQESPSSSSLLSTCWSRSGRLGPPTPSGSSSERPGSSPRSNTTPSSASSRSYEGGSDEEDPGDPHKESHLIRGG
jgi:hypothetical protein